MQTATKGWTQRPDLRTIRLHICKARRRIHENLFLTKISTQNRRRRETTWWLDLDRRRCNKEPYTFLLTPSLGPRHPTLPPDDLAPPHRLPRTHHHRALRRVPPLTRRHASDRAPPLLLPSSTRLHFQTHHSRRPRRGSWPLRRIRHRPLLSQLGDHLRPRDPRTPTRAGAAGGGVERAGRGRLVQGDEKVHRRRFVSCSCSVSIPVSVEHHCIVFVIRGRDGIGHGLQRPIT